MTKKETENILKYNDPIIEIQLMWNVKAKLIPVITWAAGTISKSLRKYLSKIAGKNDINELQKKKSHIVHCTRTAGSADVKVQNISRAK